ncbi:LysM peptidoglycan-binding domain-containing protein [Seongchinamella unica]|uniref:LysM peptidoglycan-binding domain-containing protein n=1 Tax=Seongchinamella unica TaxID=2547392 RepID=A0A4R5LSG7_9GAMM|nr:LysM peptidoglycan-binding domain-containing protein [Seongchinamella unica]TDG13776.1 LysM peptidoglycan-binding domain-containing protein [Seongchinamella unica]
MLRPLFIVISIAVSLSACQSLPGPGTSVAQGAGATDIAPEPAPATTKKTPPQVAQKPPRDLWERIRRELSWQSIHNAQVGDARDAYLNQPNYLSVVAERARLYLYYIVEEVERRDLPMELALLPLVESTLNPFATSSERAAGLWQIMPATGTHLGLEQNWWYDGRRDIRDSTRIALDYLESLYAEFEHDWMLALAAYNSGKGRVARTQRANAAAGKPTDYWSLKLPRETRHYVPRLIALTQIVAYPEAFDVKIPKVPNKPAFVVATTGGQIEMARAADLAQVEMHVLRALNPGQLRWATSPDVAQELLLPPGTEARFAEGIAGLTEADRVRWEHYRIKNGDNLIRIAKKFDTEVGLLREVNNIRGSMIRAGDTLMIPYGSDWASSMAMVPREERQRQGYRVRRGDSLYRIAGKFNVSVNDIIAWNSLDPAEYLQPGQRLTLYLGGS